MCQMTVLKQEINKLLTQDMLLQLRTECSVMRRELRKPPMQVDSTSLNREHIAVPADGRTDILLDFLTDMLKRAAKSKTKSGEIAITIHENELEQAIDTMACKLRDWKVDEVKHIKEGADTLVDHQKQLVFALEQKLKHQEFLRDVDKKAFIRRVQSEVADKNYDLVFQVDKLSRRITELMDRLDNAKEEAKEEIKHEYEDVIKKMDKENMIMKGRFASYKKNVFKEIDDKFARVKQEAINNLKRNENYSHALKQKTLEVVMEDNEKSALKMETQKRKAREVKLLVFHKLKLLALKAKYEKQVCITLLLTMF